MEKTSAKHVFEPLAWLLQLITGILLAFLITIHFYVTHLESHEAISYAAVIERLSSPSYKIMYVLLLLFVSFHAFNGLRAILLDTNFGAKRRGFTNVVTMLLFLLAFFYGFYLLLII